MAAKKDFSQVAHAVFLRATGAAPKKSEPTARQVAGSKGGKLGGKTRMDSMTKAQRVAFAKLGVAARKKAPAVEAGANSVKD